MPHEDAKNATGAKEPGDRNKREESFERERTRFRNNLDITINNLTKHLPDEYKRKIHDLINTANRNLNEDQEELLKLEFIVTLEKHKEIQAKIENHINRLKLNPDDETHVKYWKSQTWRGNEPPTGLPALQAIAQNRYAYNEEQFLEALDNARGPRASFWSHPLSWFGRSKHTQQLYGAKDIAEVRLETPGLKI
jgi:hypothetical protein